MCFVSMVTSPLNHTGPTPIVVPMVTSSPRAPQEFYDWTRPTWEQFKEIIDRLRALDEKLGLKDCEDPEKAAWMERVEARLAALESKVDEPATAPAWEA